MSVFYLILFLAGFSDVHFEQKGIFFVVLIEIIRPNVKHKKLFFSVVYVSGVIYYVVFSFCRLLFQPHVFG